MRVSPGRAAVTRLGLRPVASAALGVVTGPAAVLSAIGLAAAVLAAAVLAAAVLAAAVLSAAVLPATTADASGPGPVAATTASARPSPAVPDGQVTFTASCASLDTAAATLLGQPLGLPALIPMNAAATEGDFVVTVRLPSHLRPGGYRPRIECSDGTSATVGLQVESVRAAAAARSAAASERAAAATSTSGLSALLAACGIGLMAVGALAAGSALALRRRIRAHP